MRSSVAALIRESLLLISAALLSCALLPLSAAADEGEEDIAPLTSALVSTRTVALPATSLSEATVATITSGTVELAIAGDAGDQPIPTVRTTYVVRGCAYSFDQGAGAFALVNAANAELTEEGYLIVPASLMLDGTAYPVRSIEPYALSETRAPLVALPSEIEKVSEDAAAGCGILQAVYVSPDSETYSSYDGCLYDQPRTSLLLIPEGKQGAVRIAPSAENVDPEEFSHCPSVDSISADAGSAAFSSRNALPYDEDDDSAPLGGIADDDASGLGFDADGEGASEPIDIDSVVIDEGAFAPIVLPSDNADASAGTDSADGADLSEGDADSTASPSAAAGGPIEDAPEAEVRSMATYAVDLPSRFVTFDVNGGVEGHVPDTVWTADDGTMPSIENQHINRKVPVRDDYAFMGFYDGSDYRSASRYYNADFTQDGCVTVYPFSTDGLKLYAGWAPVISVDVPTSVSVAVGSDPSIDAPTSTTATIKNMSPWDVKATSLTWDTTSLQGSTAELDEMFGNPSALRFSISLSGDPSKQGTVAPGGTTTQSSDVGFIALSKGSTSEPTEVSFDYTMRLNDATVEKTEVVSNTSLITVFEASDAPAESVRSTVMFDINDDGESGYYLDPAEMTLGEAPASLRMPDGSPFAAPERYGHTFMGFYDEPVYDAEGAVQYFDDRGEATRAWDKAIATTLYAGWRTESGKVIFDGNGGYFDRDPSKTQLSYSVDYGESVASVLGDSFAPTAMFGSGRDPVYSSEWYTDPIGGERVGDFSAIVIDDIESPIVFYAHWDNVEGASVSVTFVANGKNATVDGQASLTKDIVLGEFQASLPTAVRPGFTFAGWYTQATGGIEVESTPSTLADMTLYAHWEGNRVTVSWDVGGWDVENPPSITYVYSDADTINTGYPSGGAYDAMDRGSGFAWDGWYAVSDDGRPQGERIIPSTPLPVESATYHAFWDATLSWDMNDGTGATESASVLLSTTAFVGDAMSADPTREDYAFDGWFTASSGGTQVTEATTVSGPATYYAHWTFAPNPAIVSFDANGGHGDVVSVTAAYGEAVPTPSGYTAPTREGYTLEGWYDTDAASGGAMYVDADGASAKDWDKADDATLYARWKLVSYAIGYTMDGGTNNPANPESYTVETDDITLTDPSRTGYSFTGWTGANGSTPQKGATIPKGSTGDKSYTASWTAKQSALTFNANGGKGDMPADKTATYDAAMPPIGTIAPTRAGYEFMGYYDGTGGDATRYYEADLSSTRNWDKDTEEGTTLYAHWRAMLSPVPNVPADGDGDFYLHLSEDQAKNVSTSEFTMAAGYYGATAIKSAAEDIASNGESSIYYGVFKNIMDNDIMFKSKWKNATADNNTAEQIDTATTEYNIRLIGLRQDYTNEARTTYAGMTFQFADRTLSGWYSWNNVNSNSTGWRDSELRARMNSTDPINCSPQSALTYGDDAARQSIWNRAPAAITSNIQPVYKLTHNDAGNTTTAVTATRDQMFLASYAEMVASTDTYYSDWGINDSYAWLKDEAVEGIVYQCWKAKGVIGNNHNASTSKQVSGYAGTSWSANGWWERSVVPGYANLFLSFGGNGRPFSSGDANYISGVASCFCF